MTRAGLLAVCLAAALLAPGEALGQAPAADWLAGEVRVAFTGLGNASATGDFAVHQLATSQGAQTAQDLRAQYQQAAAYGQGSLYLATLQDELARGVEARLAGLFPGAQVAVRGARVDPASLQAQAGQDAWHPPVRAAVEARVAFDLPGMLGAGADERVLADALAIGAQARVPFELAAPAGYNVTFRFALPPGVEAVDAPGATRSADGGEVAWSLVNWRGTGALAQRAELTLAGRGAPTQWRTDAQAQLGVDMHDVEGLTLPGALAGDFGALAVRVDARVLARSLRLDDLPALAEEVRARLPAGVQVQGLDADAFRIAVRDGLVPQAALDRVGEALRQLAAQRLAGLAQGPLDLTGGFAPGTLDPALISQPADGDPPLAYELHGDLRIPLGHGLQAVRAAWTGGPVLYQRSVALHLPRVPGMDTTYRIALPPGIALADLQLTHANATRSREAGRDVAVITPQADDAQATVTFAVTGAFVVQQFGYVLAGLLLLAVVLAAALVVLRRRRRRRARPAAAPAQVPARAPQP